MCKTSQSSAMGHFTSQNEFYLDFGHIFMVMWKAEMWTTYMGLICSNSYVWLPMPQPLCSQFCSFSDISEYLILVSLFFIFFPSLLPSGQIQLSMYFKDCRKWSGKLYISWNAIFVFLHVYITEEYNFEEVCSSVCSADLCCCSCCAIQHCPFSSTPTCCKLCLSIKQSAVLISCLEEVGLQLSKIRPLTLPVLLWPFDQEGVRDERIWLSFCFQVNTTKKLSVILQNCTPCPLHLPGCILALSTMSENCNNHGYSISRFPAVWKAV